MRDSSRDFDSWLKIDAKMLVVCMLLLAAAAGWLLLTRPVHHIEGDFLQREDLGVADEWLLEQLSNPIAEQRARAYRALARIEGPAALASLANALEDPAPSVRALAAFGIGNVLDARGPHPRPAPEAAEALLRVLHDDDRRVVSRAVEALGKIEWRAASGDITQTAAPIVVSMTALIRMGADEQAEFIAEYLESDDQDSRWAAALAVAQLEIEHTPLIAGRLLKLLTDSNEFVRAAAIRAVADKTAAAGSRDPRMTQALRESLDHRDVKVRFEAQRALSDAADPRVRNPPTEIEPLLAPLHPGPPAAPLFEPADYQPIVRTLGSRLLMTTSIGDFEIELDYENTPLTAEYFRRRAAEGALDGTPFRSVTPNGYAVAGGALGAIRSEIHSGPFLRGSLGLLRDAGASFPGEFFVCLTALPLADSRYVNFGRLVSGDNFIDRISAETVIQSIRPIP